MSKFRLGDVVALEGMPDAPQCRGVVIGFGHQIAQREHGEPGTVRPFLLVKLEDGAYLEGRSPAVNPCWPFVSVLACDPDNLARVLYRAGESALDPDPYPTERGAQERRR